MVTQTSKRILVAPLDWGLGHTTRCMPIIGYLTSLGHHPVVACNDHQRRFIEENFANIEIIHINGYNISYSKWNKFGQIGVLSQLPRISRAISGEHNWLKQHAGHLKLDGIISDNRYGLFHPSIPSVILTHQLKVISGFNNFADGAVQKLHYKYLDRFGCVWVVDDPGANNLAGKLSHTEKLPGRVAYIGLLSQFEKFHEESREKDNSILILLSGPEPQRTELSKILWQQIPDHNGKVTFVEGKPGGAAPGDIPKHVTYFSHLTGKPLAENIKKANTIICRSGYSTIMDLVAMGKKAILIPTPGQTEQEYLAKDLAAKKLFYATRQKGFNLKVALSEAARIEYAQPLLENAFSGYQHILKDWVTGL